MDKLGINGVQLIAQIVNVAILFFILKKFVYKPLLGMLEARKKEIEKGLKLSTDMQAKEEELEASKVKIVKKAKEEALIARRETLAETKKQADEIVKKAETEATKIREKAKGLYETEVKRMKLTMDEEIEKKALVLANSALAKLLDKDTRVKLTQKQLHEI